jgi:hypothetical protein
VLDRHAFFLHLENKEFEANYPIIKNERIVLTNWVLERV